MHYYTDPFPRATRDSRSIFKQSTTGLNFEFSFSYIGCPTKVKEFSQSYYLSIAGGEETSLILTFTKVICTI